jgi:REP element-mobilizing transposase RayT
MFTKTSFSKVGIWPTRKRILIHAYVIMTNHVHIISRSSDTLLEEILRDMKKFTSSKLLEAIKKNQWHRAGDTHIRAQDLCELGAFVIRAV